ncbi:MAG: tocopherol cyclase family protein [Velocimicrobium sp.]
MDKCYFEGWYFKQQNTTDTIALIPAFHRDSKGRSSASLQVIGNREAYNIKFDANSFYQDKKKFHVYLGNNMFSKQKCHLDIKKEGFELQGQLWFGEVCSPLYDIMGPFSLVPFMECRHCVISLSHRVEGMISLNKKEYVFHNGIGYIEGDRGRSFPKRYLWTQCSFEGNSIMLSVANIPFGIGGFHGCIGFVFWKGREYRIATYCGAKLVLISKDTIIVKQDQLWLKVSLLKSKAHLLRAPKSGEMTRIIHESVSCQVHYTCLVGNKTLFDFVSEQASFENNWKGFR